MIGLLLLAAGGYVVARQLGDVVAGQAAESSVDVLAGAMQTSDEAQEYALDELQDQATDAAGKLLTPILIGGAILGAALLTRRRS